MPTLKRTRDGAGDSGPLFLINRRNPETDEYESIHSVSPRIGWAVQCGSPYARSYQMQDYWQTTPVTEILEEREDGGRFRTRNSEYEWTR